MDWRLSKKFAKRIDAMPSKVAPDSDDEQSLSSEEKAISERVRLTADTPPAVGESTEVEVLPSTKKVRHQSFLDPAKRNLREEELDSPAARRFMIAEIDRLSEECDERRVELKELRPLTAENAILTERITSLQKKKGYETIIFGISSIGAGAASNYVDSNPSGWIFLSVFVIGLVSSGLRLRS